VPRLIAPEGEKVRSFFTNEEPKRFRRLYRFRYKCIPAEHPLYERMASSTIMPEGLRELNGEAGKCPYGDT
jgi:hypothetical protein